MGGPRRGISEKMRGKGGKGGSPFSQQHNGNPQLTSSGKNTVGGEATTELFESFDTS